MQNVFIPLWRNNIGLPTGAGISSVKDLRAIAEKACPMLDFLNSVEAKMHEDMPSYEIDWDQSFFPLIASMVAYAIHQIACAFWNLVSNTAQKEEALREMPYEYREQMPYIVLGQMKTADANGEIDVLKLYGLLEKAEDRYSISRTKLLLMVRMPDTDYSRRLKLERTANWDLVFSMGVVEGKDALLLMSVALELMHAEKNPLCSRVWLNYTGDVDFTPYGFKEPKRGELPLSTGEGEKWVIFHKKSEFNKVQPGIEKWEKSMASNHPIALNTWKLLIQHAPLLKLTEGVSLTDREALEALPQ
jgi:hypothetical protein